MPHITFEYTANVRIDLRSFFKELTEALVATGHVSQMGVKCRAIEAQQYYIVNGDLRYKMVNLLFRLREGRSPEIKSELSTIGMGLLEKYLSKEIEQKEIILSTEVKELLHDQDLTRNHIR